MLFAIDKDPYEQNNLADNPEYKKILSQMREPLEAWMKQQGDDGTSTNSKGSKAH